ncbi:hypothetical protein IQ244_29345 [Nostoc sp. LEGE 06077]|uniref:hypothetical protein n=1 Tax=Nostoc sp. LEGE 06077 TaxID=915325 RepID=UPI00187E5834|nr:hypothetical protein [Nostoc sp. LEGE 06077]MBE9210536.1 hypothetical protein [Nostoc sp. LEGE 06077]
MLSNYPLSDEDWQQIAAKLPSDVALLAHKYPCEIYNALDAWDDEPLPNNYIPQAIDVYNDVDDEAVFQVWEGKLERYVPSERKNAAAIQVGIDGNWVYIEIEGKVILDKLGGVILPLVNVTESSVIELLSKQI